MKTEIGPLGILDGVGLDTALDITYHWGEALGDPQLEKNAAFLRAYVEEGRLGTKTGAGFYSYLEPAYWQPGFLDGEEPRTD